MTKAKTPAPEAAPAEDQDLSLEATPETPAGQGADDAPVAETAEAAPAEAAETAENPEAAPPATEAEPELNLETLGHLARSIDMFNTTGHRLGLVDELTDLYGAQISQDDVAGVAIEMEGIKGSRADCLETALTNWANAARRAILEATA